jgi:hypothetical protein
MSDEVTITVESEAVTITVDEDVTAVAIEEAPIAITVESEVTVVEVVEEVVTLVVQATGVPGPTGPAGEVLPAGGTTGQILTKQSNADGDAVWEDAPDGGSGGGWWL